MEKFTELLGIAFCLGFSFTDCLRDICAPLGKLNAVYHLLEKPEIAQYTQRVLYPTAVQCTVDPQLQMLTEGRLPSFSHQASLFPAFSVLSFPAERPSSSHGLCLVVPLLFKTKVDLDLEAQEDWQYDQASQSVVTDPEERRELVEETIRNLTAKLEAQFASFERKLLIVLKESAPQLPKPAASE
eukprot:m.124982 g.124982  ORF g.124982 m.124982 type:complete len:185 (+) comp52194_c0_seq3:298-852(+)